MRKIMEGTVAGVCSYYVPWYCEAKLDPANDIVDLVVNLDKDEGVYYQTTLVTPAYIARRMAKGRYTGEAADGSYFEESRILIVEEISKGCVEKVLKDIVADQTLTEFFDRYCD